MSQSPASEADMLVEIGRLLQQARAQQNCSMQDMCKKMGLRIEQIEAVESGNETYFKNTTHAFMLVARLYAKKLSVELPVMSFNEAQVVKRQLSGSSKEIPLFLRSKIALS
jgi:transcriptional regulator with XRE-family HTH domain